jgi:hypothetical protein
MDTTILLIDPVVHEIDGGKTKNNNKVGIGQCP